MSALGRKSVVVPLGSWGSWGGCRRPKSSFQGLELRGLGLRVSGLEPRV